MVRWLAVLVALVGPLMACAGEPEVHRYPAVERNAETTEGGEQTPQTRATPPEDPGGPLPPDEPAAESTEPL